MRRYAVGVDLGGTVIKLGLVSADGMVGTRTFPADSAFGLGPRLPMIGKGIAELLGQNGLASEDIAGVGIAFPGLADSTRGIVLSTNAKYDDAPDIDLREWVKSMSLSGFYIDNDARMAAVGEWKSGAGVDCDNIVMMTIGTGIGCGVIVEGAVLRGVHHQAGCLGGHLTVDFRGRKCSCGNTGCLEAMASSFFLNDIIRCNTRISPGFYETNKPFDFRKIFDMARSGDVDAAAVAEECMDTWAVGIVNLIHAYDPERVVVGGGVMRSADIILPYLRKRVDELAWTPWGKVEILTSELGDDAAILGVAHYIMNK